MASDPGKAHLDLTRASLLPGSSRSNWSLQRYSHPMIVFLDCALLTGVDVMLNRMISTRRHMPVTHNASQWVKPIASKLVSKWVPIEVPVLVAAAGDSDEC